MAALYFDSSALVKRYFQEHGSPVVSNLLSSGNHRAFISQLARVEVVSAFATKVRERTAPASVLDEVRKFLARDVAAGLFSVLSLTSNHFRAAQLLIVKHGASCALRTLDAIQLAACMDLRSNLQGRETWFVSADERLNAVAGSEGLVVLNPTATRAWNI